MYSRVSDSQSTSGIDDKVDTASRGDNCREKSYFNKQKDLFCLKQNSYLNVFLKINKRMVYSGIRQKTHFSTAKFLDYLKICI